MKTKVYIVQSSTGLCYELSFENSNDSKIDAKTFIYGALPRFFSYVHTMKGVGAKGAKLSEPFAVKVVSKNKVLVDTQNIDENPHVSEAFGAKLKLSNNWEGRRRFAERIRLILEHAEQTFGPLTYDKLVESLKD